MPTCASVTALDSSDNCQRNSRRILHTGNLRRVLNAVVFAAAAILLLTPTAGAAPPPTSTNTCQQGAFCTWAEESYRGTVHNNDSTNAAMEQCLVLPGDPEARSFVNNTGHPVTVYQDPDCSTNADFSTYPSGASVSRPSYVARAIKVWTH